MKTKYLFLLFIASLSISIFLSFYPKLITKNNESVLSPITYRISPSQTPTPTPTPIVSFGLVGDLGLGRYITSIARSKNDFSWSFQKVSHLLQQNDFNLANLESPIIKDCPEGKTGTFTFCGDPRFLPELKSNKFIFSLANNHIFNYGQDGFSQTTAYLDEFQIGYYYSHSSDIEFFQKDIKGISFGFLSFDYITNPNLRDDFVLELVKKYHQQVNWLIVSLHWGNEYLPSPEKWRLDLAHQLIDAGADIIHGHHPHVLQLKETYKGKPIFYSLGNFIFDQNWSLETSKSEIVTLTVTKTEVLDSSITPLIIKFNSQPQEVI